MFAETPALPFSRRDRVPRSHPRLTTVFVRYSLADPLKSMILRGVDSQLAAKLREVAAREGKSVNQAALDALRKHFGLNRSRPHTEVHRDMDHLFGRWDEEEFARIQEKIDSGRCVDPELWK